MAKEQNNLQTAKPKKEGKLFGDPMVEISVGKPNNQSL